MNSTEEIYYIMITLVIFSMVTMIVHINHTGNLKGSCRKWFTISFAAIILGAFTECLGTAIDGSSLPNWQHTAVTLVQFCTTPCVSLFISYALEVRRPANWFGTVMLLHVTAEVLLAQSGGIFYIDQDGFYHRGHLYIIYMLSYAVSLVYLLVLAIYMSRRFRRRDVATLLLGIVILILGIVPSVLRAEVETSFLGVSLLAVILYVYYKDLVEQDLQDGLTARNEKIKFMQLHTIIGMANLIESRDGSTGEHVKNTAEYASMLAKEARSEGLYADELTDDYIELIAKSAPLHDIGKVVVPDDILNKPGKFTDEEYEIMKTHTREGGRIVKEILSGVVDDDYTEVASHMAEFHHERWDGKGYPHGLSGTEIPLCARIMSIADVYDALVSERVYKQAMPRERALEIIRAGADTQFDPYLAEAFVNCWMEEGPEPIKIYRRHKKERLSDAAHL